MLTEFCWDIEFVIKYTALSVTHFYKVAEPEKYLLMANYYSIDDILAEEEVNMNPIIAWIFPLVLCNYTKLIFFSFDFLKLIPVVFQKAATGVGLLDPSSETNNVSFLKE